MVMCDNTYDDINNKEYDADFCQLHYLGITHCQNYLDTAEPYFITLVQNF